MIARSLPVTRLEDTAIRCAVIGARAADGAEVVITSAAAVATALHVVNVLLAGQLARDAERFSGRVPVAIVPPLRPHTH